LLRVRDRRVVRATPALDQRQPQQGQQP
jgi:hypothetical protein